MINVIATIHVKTGKMNDYLNILKLNLPLFAQEQGCIEYFPTVDVPTRLPIQFLDENVITIIEKWETMEDLMNHLKAPHYLAYKKDVKDMVEKVLISVLKKI